MPTSFEADVGSLAKESTVLCKDNATEDISFGKTYKHALNQPVSNFKLVFTYVVSQT